MATERHEIEVPCVCGKGVMKFTFARSASGINRLKYFLAGEADSDSSTCNVCGRTERIINCPIMIDDIVVE